MMSTPLPNLQGHFAPNTKPPKPLCPKHQTSTATFPQTPNLNSHFSQFTNLVQRIFPQSPNHHRHFSPITKPSQPLCPNHQTSTATLPRTQNLHSHFFLITKS